MNGPTTKANHPQEETQGQRDYRQGQTFFEKGDQTLAANAFHNAMVSFEQENNREGLANACAKLGDICAARDDFDGAISLYDRAGAICKEFDDLFSLLALQKKIALCHRGKKDYLKAMDIYLDLLETYERLNSPGLTVETIITMGETYLEQGNKEKAADSFRTAASIHANFKHSRQAQDLEERAAAVEAGSVA